MVRAIAERDLIRPALILEILAPDGDAVLDALPFTDEAKSRLRAVSIGAPPPLGLLPAIELLGEGFEPFNCLGFEAAIGQLLDAIRQPAFKESAVIWRRGGIKEIVPLSLQIGHGAPF